ncbi:DNA-binding transcriptional MerR regulator [Ancylobacter polymorphus]|uniref:DNA-binding transcriptional MerR regulator n=1 Tax=Ancylobacter polymorphus TaxID=223390 RepID=A0ABU0B620_9HYPH|nr:DNA-binding transcriptional MerR regulator [Ancylobacter polymorphus]
MSARQDQPGAEKGPDAFRTISEVAEDLDLPQHVLRFWETRFPQIRPLKRGGGRRYYRPDDVELLRGIRHLLYGEGYTIRGVQRILKEEGPRYVQALAREVDGEEGALPEPGRLEEREAPPPSKAAFSHDEPSTYPTPPGADTDGGTDGGLLDLLPGRPFGPTEDVSSRRTRRRPESEPAPFDLPLLADLEPPPRTVRPVPFVSGDPSPFSPRQGNRADDTPNPESHLPQERAAPEPMPGEARPSFPFRPMGAGPATLAEDEVNFVRERVRPVTPLAQREPAGSVHVGAIAPTTLRGEDLRRLEAVLHELQDCQRLLDAARDRDN